MPRDPGPVGGVRHRPRASGAASTSPALRAIVNIGLLEDEHLQPGDWVLIHVGFAMSKIDEEEASLALESLKMMGQAFGDELEAFRLSKISSNMNGG